MVRNRKLAKSIHDASWGICLQWLARYGLLHAIPVIAVAPHYTSQKCSNCSTIVQKSLSVRTHICHGCGVILDRDYNAALNILQKALSPDQNGTEGHSGTDELVS
jgi:transposase